MNKLTQFKGFGGRLKRIKLVTSTSFLSIIFLLSIVGTIIELFLLDHIEDYWQLSPVILLLMGLIVFFFANQLNLISLWHLFKIIMILLIIDGIIGIWMHYQTNVEFEIEMYQGLKGFNLFKKAMKGATPFLAPGAMIMIGLIGWLHTLNNKLTH